MGSRWRRGPSVLNPIGGVLAGTRGLRRITDHAPPVSASVWQEAVGSRIARRARPVRLDGKTLIVRVGSAAWANELSMLAPDILAQLAKRDVHLDALRFKVGKLPERPRFRTDGPVKERLVAGELPADLQTHIDAIDDDDLRRAIGDAAARSVKTRG